MAQTSNEQIVRQIIDILSDGVSELVLLVVVLREQNAQMPPSLPTHAIQVNDTAKKLGLIARKLAATDYKDFQEIAVEINEASDALDEATKTMEGAVKMLSGGAKQKGWDDLVDACRVMSGKTIRLLQIVYGAPLKRLKINADRLAAEINKFPPNPRGLHDPKNQQKLLDDLKPITDKALRLEKHLNDRAKAAETPQARKQLQDAANDARKAAEDLVAAVNHALSNPDKPADLSKPLENLRNAVDRGRDLADKHSPPAPKGIQNVPMPPPGHKGPQTHQQSTGPKNLHDEVQHAKDLANEIPNIARREPHRLPEAQDKLKDAVENIRKKAQPPDDVWDREVEQPFQQQRQAARAAQNPNNPNPKALDDATRDLVKGLDNVGKSHPTSQRPGGAPATPASPGQPRGGPAPPRGKGPHGHGGHDGDKHYPVDPDTRRKVADQLAPIAPEFARAIAKPTQKQKNG
jgi:uncharacterized protein YukE